MNASAEPATLAFDRAANAIVVSEIVALDGAMGSGCSDLALPFG